MSEGLLLAHLLQAIRGYNVARVTTLLEQGVDVDRPGENGWTPLMLAVEMESNEIIELLLQHGASPNARGNDGSTALHIAVDIAIDGTWQRGLGEDAVATDAIVRLLRADADVDARNLNGESALDWARRYECARVVALLTGCKHSD